MAWEDEVHSSYDIDTLDKEFKRRLYKDDPATQLIREVLAFQACRCQVCKGPATRELQLGYSPLFCDEHGGGPEGTFIDLRRADWTRRAVALLKERDGT